MGYPNSKSKYARFCPWGHGHLPTKWHLGIRGLRLEKMVQLSAWAERIFRPKTSWDYKMTWACFSRKCICFQHHFWKSKWLFVGSDWVCLGYLEHHFVSLNFVLGMPFCKWGGPVTPYFIATFLGHSSSPYTPSRMPKLCFRGRVQGHARIGAMCIWGIVALHGQS